jgi:hypothetical protein
MSLSVLVFVERVSFTSIAVKNGISVGCIQKVSLLKLSSYLFFAMDVAVATFAGEGVFV